MDDNTALVHLGGGLGNVMMRMVRGQFAARLAGLDGCCLWWRTKNPLVHESALDTILDVDHFSRRTGLRMGCMNNREGWDFFHTEEVSRAAKWDSNDYWGSLLAYSGSWEPKYRMVTSSFPMSVCRMLDWTGAYRAIRPATDLAARVESEARRLLQGRSLGVHVRRTDRRPCNRHSTDTRFFGLIDPVKDEYDTIFLATDNPAVEETFLSRYGGKVVFTDKPKSIRWAGYKQRKEIVTIDFYRDAVVDLWLLARCDRIIGSYSSSFSKSAARVSVAPSMKITFAM